MSDDPKFKIITSALPYVNNLPHLGNIVGCVLSSDVYSRFCKKSGQDCIHICGTDEYGTATEIKAMEEKKHPREICEENSKKHKEVYDWFNINFDYFGRTSCSEHKETVHEIFKDLYDNNYFEEKEMKQFFCNNCHLFLADRYIRGICPKCKSDKARGDQCDDCQTLIKSIELIDAKCMMCESTPVIKETNHLYLRLDLLQDQLKIFFESNGEKWSKNAKEITKQWMNIDLHSRCMTRDLKYKWGIPVPIQGFEEKVFYVWFDAPIGYLTFIKNILKEKYNEKIKSKNTQIFQFMGKDNVPFHSIIFPAMLIGTKRDYKLVDVINSTEYLNFQNEKFSKSRGIGIFGGDLLGNELGPSCFWRYYLMKIRPETKDSNFSYEDFKNNINSDLINNFGNLINRCLTFIKKNNNCIIQYEIEKEDKEFIENANAVYKKYLHAMENCEIRKGVELFLELSSLGNSYLQSAFSDSKNKLKNRKTTIFSIGSSLINLIAHVAEPFIPETSKKIFKMLNVQEKIFPNEFTPLKNGHNISNDLEVVFKTFTKQQEEKFK